jgi:transcriptional regulator with XRE-family HTH domain
MASIRPLANYLLTHRKRSGFTQEELAYLLGCKHRSKVSHYERGPRTPSLVGLIGYEVVFRAPVRDLFKGTYASLHADIRARAIRLHKRLDARPLTPRVKQKLDALVEIIYPGESRRAA